MFSLFHLAKVLDSLPFWVKTLHQPRNVSVASCPRPPRLEKEADRKAVSEMPCPACGEYSFFVVHIQNNPVMGAMGVQDVTLRCKSCGYQETRTE